MNENDNKPYRRALKFKEKAQVYIWLADPVNQQRIRDLKMNQSKAGEFIANELEIPFPMHRTVVGKIAKDAGFKWPKTMTPWGKSRARKTANRLQAIEERLDRLEDALTTPNR